MLALVYCCKWQGQRLDRQAIQGNPKRGDLVVRKRGFYHRIALLLAADGETYVLPVLDKVRLLAINDRGVLLSGIEMHPPRGLKGSGPTYEQVWWCVTKDVPLRHVSTEAETEERAALERGQEVGRTMTGHHERHRR